MPLELQTYDVSVARDGLDLDKALEAGLGDGYHTHRVTVLHADQLVAEQAGARFGVGTLQANPITWATLWCWAGLRRRGLEVPEFPLFKGRCLSVDLVKGEATPVDPTTPPADTGSP